MTVARSKNGTAFSQNWDSMK